MSTTEEMAQGSASDAPVDYSEINNQNSTEGMFVIIFSNVNSFPNTNDH